MRPLLIAVTALSTALAPAGSGWSIQPTPNPSQHENLLYGVSCPSAAACTAVGGGFSAKQQVPRNIALTWNGSRWSAASVPDPAGAAYSILKDVSCASASTCIAVGDDSSGTVGVARSGTRWSVLSTVNPPTAESSQLHSVSCRSATACTAVGWYEQIVGSALRAFSLAETWNGKTWSIQPTPNVGGGASTYLTGVSCTSATACTAAGHSAKGNNGISRPLAEAWNGKTWSIQATPNPAGAISSSLARVSCASATMCIAVGGSNNASNGRPLAEAWNGKTWSIQATPRLSSADAFFAGVSCTSAVACTAAGVGQGPSDEVTGAFWPSGGSRAMGSGGLPPERWSAPPGQQGGGTLAEAWHGKNWSVQPTPNPAGSGGTFFEGVSCSSAAACTAIGYYDGSTTVATLAERHSG